MKNKIDINRENNSNGILRYFIVGNVILSAVLFIKNLRQAVVLKWYWKHTAVIQAT